MDLHTLKYEPRKIVLSDLRLIVQATQRNATRKNGTFIHPCQMRQVNTMNLDSTQSVFKKSRSLRQNNRKLVVCEIMILISHTPSKTLESLEQSSLFFDFLLSEG